MNVIELVVVLAFILFALAALWMFFRAVKN
jgi:hypothetical protein